MSIKHCREDVSRSFEPQPEWSVDIEVSKHRWKVRGAVAYALASGITFCFAGFIVASAYVPKPIGDPLPLLMFGGMFSLAGSLFFAAATGCAIDLLRSMRDAELMIDTQTLNMVNLAKDNQWLLACLNRRAGAGEAERGEVGASDPRSADIFTINGRKPSRFQ